MPAVVSMTFLPSALLTVFYAIYIIMKIVMNFLLRLRRFYWWLSRPQTRGVRAILRNPQGEILLVRHSYGEGWYLPGGRVKNGEGDQIALQREIFEETGIRFDAPATPLGIYLNEREYKKDTIAVFVVESFHLSQAFDVEIKDKKFFSPSRLPENVSPGTKRRIEEWQGKRTLSNDW